MKRKPVVGETLFDLNVGNAARRGVPQILTPVVVTSVGRKYFTCATTKGLETIYHLSNWQEKTDYCRDHHLYETAQQWEDEKEARHLVDLIQAEFGSIRCYLPLETLRAIKSLMDASRIAQPTYHEP